MINDVFISYSHNDKSFAYAVFDALSEAGLMVWMDRGGITGGAQWERKIQQALRNSLSVLVIITPKSLDSPFVQDELLRAVNLNLPFIPVLLAEVDPDIHYAPMRLDGYQRIDAKADQSSHKLTEIVRSTKETIAESQGVGNAIPDVFDAHENTQSPDVPAQVATSTIEPHPKDLTITQAITGRGRKENRIFNAVRAGATDVEATNKAGQTALHYAVLNGEAEIVHLLLERGANVNARDNDGIVPLHYAIEDVGLSRLLLLKGADFAAKDARKRMPLHYAYDAKATQTRHLLELWAEVKQGKTQSNDALRVALKLPTHKVERILDAVAVGADDVTATDKAGRTALHWAAQAGEADLVKMLLDKGADAKALDGAGNTPFDLARQNSQVEVESVLAAWKEKGASTSRKKQEAEQSQAVEESLNTIEAPKTTDEANSRLKSALLSIGRYKARTVLSAIRGGATDFSFIDQRGRTALYWAVRENDTEAVKIALSNGAKADAPDEEGETPLDVARANEFAEVVALLSAPSTAATSNATAPTQRAPKRVEVIAHDGSGNTNTIPQICSSVNVTPAKKYDVFIVCSHLNEYFGERIQPALKRNGLNAYLWLDSDSVSAEAAALNDSRLTLLIASSPSLNSSGVQDAIETAQKVDLPIIAAQIGNLKSRPDWLDRAVWVDSHKDQSDANLSAIVAAIKAELDKADALSTKQPSVGEGENWYSINGVEKLRSKKASEVVANALRELAQLAPQFLGDVEEQLLARKGNKVQKRRWLARTKEGLYSNPEFHNHSVEIIPGWWLGTNYSNDSKKDMLAVAREVASKLGIEFDFQLA